MRRITLFLALALALPSLAVVKVHGLFTDNMVLQRNATVPVWGTAAPGARVGDEVVIIGKQGRKAITAAQAAAVVDTIPYEVTTALTGRVPRAYLS